MFCEYSYFHAYNYLYSKHAALGTDLRYPRIHLCYSTFVVCWLLFDSEPEDGVGTSHPPVEPLETVPATSDLATAPPRPILNVKPEVLKHKL